MKPLAHAKALVAEVLRPGDRAVDATAGNGHDTLHLAKCVGVGGRVFAFDLQEAALKNTRERLEEAEIPEERAELFHESHTKIADRVSPGVGAIMFNLGYLPGSDKALITQTEDTLEALKISLPLLRPGGILTIMCYPGHEGGREEADAVTAWAEELPDEKFQVKIIKSTPDSRQSKPFLIAITEL